MIENSKEIIDGKLLNNGKGIIDEMLMAFVGDAETVLGEHSNRLLHNAELLSFYTDECFEMGITYYYKDLSYNLRWLTDFYRCDDAITISDGHVRLSIRSFLCYYWSVMRGLDLYLKSVQDKFDINGKYASIKSALNGFIDCYRKFIEVLIEVSVGRFNLYAMIFGRIHVMDLLGNDYYIDADTGGNFDYTQYDIRAICDMVSKCLSNCGYVNAESILEERGGVGKMLDLIKRTDKAVSNRKNKVSSTFILDNMERLYQLLDCFNDNITIGELKNHIFKKV